MEHVKIFAKTLESSAAEQIEQLASSSAYEDSKMRIMPDAHAGKGCTIGTTMTISDKVTPNLVGVDIGCGMLTVKLYTKRNINLDELDEFINNNVPVGFSIYDNPIAGFDFSELRCYDYVDINRAARSIGTLGGGDHFIELSKGCDKSLYLIIHSGSRNIGKMTCDHYQRLADELHPELSSLAYLEGGPMNDYLNDTEIVQRYAALNRLMIANRILDFLNVCEVNRFETIHNYIEFSRMILRKGAVSAEFGEQLLIPINMRDGSLLCAGKGNQDWNYSAPHGAGRVLSRADAKKNLLMSDFCESMSGIYSTSVVATTIDESPMAYKPMDEIISAIGDTVDIIDILKPIYNFKSH